MKQRLAVYWLDSRKLLTHLEKQRLVKTGHIERVNSTELVMRDVQTNRMVGVRSMSDPMVAADFAPRALA